MSEENEFAGAVNDFISNKQPEPKPSLQYGLATAYGSNPDYEAELRKLSAKTGVPLDTARNEKDAVKRQAFINDVNPELFQSQYPKVSAFLANPDNAAVAHDDIDNMSRLEQLFGYGKDYTGALGKGVIGSGAGSTLSGLGELYGVSVRATDRALSYVMPDSVMNFLRKPVIPWFLSPEQILKRPGNTLKTVGNAIGPDQSRQTLGTDVTEGIGQLGFQIASYLLSGGATSTSMLYAQGADAMAEKTANDKPQPTNLNELIAGTKSAAEGGASTAQRDAAILAGGVITALTEKYGIEKLVNRIPPNIKNATLRYIADKAAAGSIEAFQELTEGIGHDLTRKLLTNEDAPVLDGVTKEMTVAGLSAAIVRGALGLRGYHAAVTNQNIMEALGEAAGESKLLQRLPEKYREFVKNARENGPIQNVYIDAEAFKNYFQNAGVDPAEIANEVGARNYMEALAAGTDVVIPIEDYATHLAATEHHAALIQDAKFNIDDMTPRQAKAFEAEKNDRIKQLAEEFDKMGGEQDTGYQAIYNDMLGKLDQYVDPTSAQSYATIMAKGLSVLASRAGVDPMELYKFYDPSLTNDPIKDRKLNQSIDQTNTPEFRNWFGDSKVVDSEGKPLVVYHGTASDFSAFEKSKAQDKDGRRLSMGWGKGKFYFASSGEAASGAASGAEYFGRGKNQNVMPVFLKIENPISASEYMSKVSALQDSGMTRDKAISVTDKEIRKAGIDGIIDTESGGMAVFEPAQIKSAIGNRGTFDPNDPNILHQSEFTPANTDAVRIEVAWTETGDHNGFPTWKNDKVALANPRDVTKSVDAFYVPQDGLKAVKYDIQNPAGENVGYIVLELDGDWPTMAIDIETNEDQRGNHYGEQAIAGVLADVGSIDIWNIDPKALTFWDRIGTHSDGTGGTLSFDAYAYARAERTNARNYKGGVSYNQPAYHGSPYRFDKFSLEHMGKGEGAQAYGWGLYFAGSKEVGEYYKDNLGAGAFTYDGQQIYGDSPKRVAVELLWSWQGDKQGALDDADGYGNARAIKSEIKKLDFGKIKQGGQLYKVEIPEDDTMLHWDKPLSEQPEKVRAALAAYDPETYSPEGDEYDANETGQMAYKRLESIKGSDEAASKYLNSLGISGIKYLDGQSRGKGEGNYNYVVFDDKAIKTLETYYQPAQTENRGYISFGADNKVKIGLLEKADLSTFLHETGHFWLEVMGDLASDEKTAAGVKDDYAAILKWFGVENRQGIEVKHHEKFARAFEAYLMEGKAPSEDLRPAFQRFKAWLTLIYKKMMGLQVTLNDDVRGVFDRILATDDEIEAAKRSSGIDAIFTTAADAGMSEAEFNAYRDTVEQASERAKEELQANLMDEYSRAQKTWYKAERANVIKEVEAEIAKDPTYIAFDALVSGKTPDGTDIKLNKADLVERFGTDITSKLPRGFQRVYATEGGMASDVAAEMLGFKSPEALIEALTTMKPKRDVITAEADYRMRSRYGSIAQDGSIADKAIDAVHNEYRARVMMTELRALKRKQREVGKVLAVKNAEDAQQRSAMQDSIPPIDVVRRIAAGQIGQKMMRDINPNAYLNAERKASKQAFDLAAKGQYQEAAVAKQRELMNHFLYREAIKAQNDIEALRKHASDLQTTRAQQRIGKAGSSYLENINALLEQYEFKPVSGVQLDRRANLLSWYNAQIEAGFNPAIDPKLLENAQQVNYKEVPVYELRAVSDALKSIEFLARKKNKLLGKNEQIEFNDAIDDLVASAQQNTKAIKPRSIDPALRTVGNKVTDWFRSWDADILPIETVIDWLDGGKADGPWHKYLFNPASESQSAELDTMGKLGDRIGKLLDEFHMNDKSYLLDKFTFDGVGTVSRYWLISVALNCGNESNYDKLLRGNNMTAQQVNMMLSKLTASDWKFVQSVWNEVNTLWPEIAKLEKRMSGVEPAKVEPRPFTVTDEKGNAVHTVEGGYFPAVYDPRFSQAGQKQESGPLAGLLEKGYAYATTPKGHTKARTEFAAPLLLDFGQVTQRHLSGVVKDLTHREFLVDANRIINNPRIRQTLQEQLGDQYERMFMPWLRSIANDRNVSPSDGLTGLDRFIESSRANVTTVALGYKVTSIIAQIAGAANSIEIVGSKWFSAGMMQSLNSPAKTYQMVVEKSGEMRHRFDTIDRDVRDELRQMRSGNVAKWHSSINRAAFFGINVADRMVTIPTWVGAYNKALSEGMGEPEAIHQADAAVRRSQGAGGAKDLSAIQRKRGAIKMLTMFFTPFAAQYGRLRTAGQQLGVHGMKYAPEAVLRTALITMIPAVLSDLLADRGPKECAIDDPTCFAKWGAIKSVFSITATVPLLREIGNLGEKMMNADKPGNRDMRISPVIDMFDKVSKTAIKSYEVAAGKQPADEKFYFDLFETSGYIANLPTGQARITLQYLYDLLDGNAKPDSALTLLHDMAFRRKEK